MFTELNSQSKNRTDRYEESIQNCEKDRNLLKTRVTGK